MQQVTEDAGQRIRCLCAGWCGRRSDFGERIGIEARAEAAARAR